MTNFRNAVKLATALLALWLGLVWAQALPRPAFLPPEVDIEPLTFLLGAVAALLFGFWKTPAATASAENTTATPPDASIHAELSRYLTARYTQRIGSKLAGRFPVNLRILPSHTGTSDEGKANFISLRDEEVGHEIGEIFDRANGRLLVIGLPGAGKTTLLLQLAVELLRRASTVPAALAAGISGASGHPGHPAAKAAGTVTPALPVLLNLATWRTEFGTFEEWLRRILPNELGASKALAEKIRATTPLILLLDGLDEVPKADRDSCLTALGQYGMKPENQYVVSTRIAEYAAAKDAPVYAQIEVAPLTAEQIEMGLTAYAGLAPEAKPLLNAIQKDPLLKQAIENPFYLNTAQLLFASGKNWSEFSFVAEDVAGRQRELVGRFVEYALGHTEKRAYPAEKARRWLGFLAGKMEKHRLRLFELIDLQPSWSGNQSWQRVLFDLKWSIPTGITILLLIKIGTGQPDVLGELLAYTIVLGILLSMTWDLLKPLLLVYLLLFIKKFMPKWYPAFVLIIVAPIILLLLKSLTKGTSIIINYRKILHPYQSLMSFKFVIFWHLILRLILSFQSSLPLRLVHFLNEMSRRHLLEFDGNLDTESGGGAWRWRHRIIQEYFLDEESRERKKA